jgi:hypothetical protein
MTDTTTPPAPPGVTLSTGWQADKKYSVSFSMSTRLITGLYGAIAPFADVVHTDTDLENHYLGPISKDLYDNITQSILAPSQMAFWLPDNTLKMRKALVNFGPNTYLDNKKKAIVGVDNLITLIPQIIDETGAQCEDITQIEIKNLQKLDFPMSIDGADPTVYKSKTTNGGSVTFQLNKIGYASIRFKALVPELSSVWLSLYPELYGYDADQMIAFNTWVQGNQSTPNTV